MGELKGTKELFAGRHFDREIRPMLGFKNSTTPTITIAGVELLHHIRKGQFALYRLRLKDRAAPAIWNAVLAA
jgi:hypothetical protein